VESVPVAVDQEPRGSCAWQLVHSALEERTALGPIIAAPGEQPHALTVVLMVFTAGSSGNVRALCILPA